MDAIKPAEIALIRYRSVVADRERSLSAFALREIRAYEGVKHSFDVAQEFRINPSRVRAIWDGDE